MSLLILDLGGVLFDIEFERTRQALLALPGYNGTPIDFGVEQQSEIFVSYDRGDISTTEFRLGLRSLYGFTCDDSALDRAWCSILDKGLYHDACQRVEQFKQMFKAERTVILSNISELHHHDSEVRCKPVFDLVDTVYLSYVIRLRKPDPKAFQYVCEAEGYRPERAVLVDDSASNCRAAEELGMTVLQWQI